MGKHALQTVRPPWEGKTLIDGMPQLIGEIRQKHSTIPLGLEALVLLEWTKNKAVIICTFHLIGKYFLKNVINFHPISKDFE